MKMVYIYILTVVVSWLLSSAAQSQGGYYSRTGKRSRNVFVYLLILFYILLLGCRYLNYLYSDEWLYRQPSAGPILTLSMVFKPEGLGSILTWLSENIFTVFGGAFEYGQFYILSTSIIVSTLFVLSMWDYSDDFSFSVFLFVTMWFAFTSMNIIRQFVAVSILFYGQRYMVKNQFGRYAFTVILATGFHASAIIMLPLYFIMCQKHLTKWMYLIIAAAVFLLDRIGSIGGALLGDSKYTAYFEMNTYGVNALRILAYAIPSILVLLNSKKILSSDARYTSFVNMIVFVLVVQLFSLQNVYYNRISFYFTCACLILFPLIPHLYGRGVGSLVKPVMITLFFLFGLYQAYISAPYHNILFENISGILY